MYDNDADNGNSRNASYAQPSPSIDSPSVLRVSADPEGISPVERKRRVKKLAGAISHSLRVNGEVNVRALGKSAITKGAKALCVARKFVDQAGVGDKQLSLSYSPAFITTEIEGKELTGICFYTFANEKSEIDNVDMDQVKTVLKVRADPKDITPEERKKNVKKLAAAIAHALEENQECIVRAIAKAATAKASKAIAIARGLTATRGPDLYCWSDFIIAHDADEIKEKTGIAYYVFTNETAS